MRKSVRSPRSSAFWLVMLLLFALVAAACGGDDNGDTEAEEDGTEQTAESDVDPNGILRVGRSLAAIAVVHFDPTQSVIPVGDRQWHQLVYGTLLRQTAKGTIEPMMARSYALVDPQTVTLTLRDGVTFTDGATYDAEAVKAGLLRTLNESSAASNGTRARSFREIADIIVDGPLELTIKLKTPVGGEFVTTLADREGVIVSPKQAAEAPQDIDTKPASAGPYTVAEVQHGQLVSLRKNNEYFDADKWRLAGIDFINVVEGSAKVNGLLTGTIDFAITIGDADAAPIVDNPDMGVTSSITERNVQLVMCTGKAPFDSEKFRQAVQVGIDRAELNKLGYADRAKVAYGFWPEGTPSFSDEVKKLVTFAPDKAKELLSDSGVSDPTFDLYYGTTLPEHARVSEVLQAQLGEVGIKVNIVPIRDYLSEFIQPQKPGAVIIPGTRTGVEKYATVFAEGQNLALCGQTRPDVMDIVTPASALVPGSDEAAELFQEADLLVAQHAYVIPLVNNPVLHAWAKSRVGGTPAFSTAHGDTLYDSMYIKKK